MSVYCWDCTEKYLGLPGAENDFNGIVHEGQFIIVQCEGCEENNGMITVNDLGQKIVTKESDL